MNAILTRILREVDRNGPFDEELVRHPVHLIRQGGFEPYNVLCWNSTLGHVILADSNRLGARVVDDHHHVFRSLGTLPDGTRQTRARRREGASRV